MFALVLVWFGLYTFQGTPSLVPTEAKEGSWDIPSSSTRSINESPDSLCHESFPPAQAVAREGSGRQSWAQVQHGWLWLLRHPSLLRRLFPGSSWEKAAGWLEASPRRDSDQSLPMGHCCSKKTSTFLFALLKTSASPTSPTLR